MSNNRLKSIEPIIPFFQHSNIPKAIVVSIAYKHHPGLLQKTLHDATQEEMEDAWSMNLI